MKWCLDCGAVQARAGACQSCGGSYQITPLRFRDLYEAYAEPLRRFVRRLAADRGLPESQVDTEGVVHDTFVILLSGSGQPIRNPAAWLFTVARNQLSKAASHQRRIAPGDPADHLRDDTTALWSSPPADAEDIRAAREVMDAVAGLPDNQRIATYLRQVEGWSLAEIGAYLNCAASTAGVHITRGTAKVRWGLSAGRDAYIAGHDLIVNRMTDSRIGSIARYDRRAYLRYGRGHRRRRTLLVALITAGFLAGGLVACMLGMSWWPGAVTGAVTAAAAALLAVAVRWVRREEIGRRLQEEAAARRRQRRFNRWLRTGRPLNQPAAPPRRS